MADYEFTSDWFTARIPVWQQFFRPLAGEPVHTLEIGSHEGRSALWVLENVLTHPAAIITCVDPWADREIERRFDWNVAASGKSDQLVKRKGPSWRELRDLPPGRFAFVYIDGCHEGLNVLEDAVLSFRLLRPGGLLCFDDYLWQNEQRGHLPREAIDTFLGLYDRQVEVLERGYQVWGRVGGFKGTAIARSEM